MWIQFKDRQTERDFIHFYRKGGNYNLECSRMLQSVSLWEDWQNVRTTKRKYDIYSLTKYIKPKQDISMDDIDNHNLIKRLMRYFPCSILLVWRKLRLVINISNSEQRIIRNSMSWYFPVFLFLICGSLRSQFRTVEQHFIHKITLLVKLVVQIKSTCSYCFI